MNNILIIGGTNFIGRNLVESLLATGTYTISLLNRGKTNPDLFPEINTIIADRNTEEICDAIQGDWDAIIDVSAYYPKSVERILSAMPKQVKQYIFVSTCSVYAEEQQGVKDEQAQTLRCADHEWEDTHPQTYGKRKATCEELIMASEIPYTILRPSLVYGQYDHTDRFYYWLHQVQQYDEILMPNHGKQLLSLTYVHDLVQSIQAPLSMGSRHKTYNVISFQETSISQIVSVASELLNKSPRIVSLPSEFLHENGISEWMDMPLWIDHDDIYSHAALLQDFPITLTEFSDSVAATIQYYESLAWPDPSYGMKREKQLDVLKTYRAIG